MTVDRLDHISVALSAQVDVMTHWHARTRPLQYHYLGRRCRHRHRLDLV